MISFLPQMRKTQEKKKSGEWTESRKFGLKLSQNCVKLIHQMFLVAAIAQKSGEKLKYFNGHCKFKVCSRICE